MDLRALQRLEIGSGRVFPVKKDPAQNSARFDLAPSMRYSNAQWDDTTGRNRRDFLWKPPLRLSLAARVSPAKPLGTFGFGFWNDPFSFLTGMGGANRKMPTMPDCAWFFYMSEPGDLPLAKGISGNGWKAATLHSPRLPFAILVPLISGGMLAAAIPFFRRAAFSLANRFYAAEEFSITEDPSQWHTYALEWNIDFARFEVDGQCVLQSQHPPTGPLGLVIWMDNQYAIASAEKGFGFGVLPLEAEQWLEISSLRIEADSCT